MKNLLSKWAVLILSAVILGGLFSGCSWSIGGGKGRTATTQATRGQELIDLKKARDQGVITEEEYQAQRKEILAK